MIELERLAKVMNSPALSATREIIKGTEVLRVYRKRNFMVDVLERKFDAYYTCRYHNTSSNFYINVRADYSTLVFITFSIVALILAKKFR